MEKIQIGIIVKPQGIKGELKIKSLTDDNSRFLKLKDVLIDDVSYKILSCRVLGGDVYLYLGNVYDRNAAEKFRGRSVFINREHAVELPCDRYFIVDIIGCVVVSNCENNYGTVNDVFQYGAADVYSLSSNIMFPFLSDVVLSVDIKNKTILVDEKRFKEVAVFEDQNED